MLSVKISSYNVLSSHLSAPSYYSSLAPEHLNPKGRLDRLKNVILHEETKDKAIICLQEVSNDWAGSLHPYFAAKGYHMITALYGRKFDGYMGVAVAIPTDKYELVDVDISRIADTKRLPFRAVALKRFTDTLVNIAVRIGLLTPRFDLWKEITNKMNQMICVRVKDRATGKQFVVGNYHMPCSFRIPQIMTAHCALSAQKVIKFAGPDPYVFAGDFNIMPGSPQYQLLTQGSLPESHNDYPDKLENDSWTPNVSPPFRSAYVTCNGSEPDCTNYSQCGTEPPFIGTLDYIFHSSEWQVESVKKLPTRETVGGPLPNQNEPSDHILISANLTQSQS